MADAPGGEHAAISGTEDFADAQRLGDLAGDLAGGPTEGGERVVRLFLAKGPVENSEATLKDTVAKFSERIRMRFEFIDLRNVRTAAEFHARTATLGWGLEVLPK